MEESLKELDIKQRIEKKKYFIYYLDPSPTIDYSYLAFNELQRQSNGELRILEHDWYVYYNGTWELKEKGNSSQRFEFAKPYRQIATDNEEAFNILKVAGRLDDCAWLTSSPKPPCNQGPNFNPDGESIAPSAPKEQNNNQNCSNTGQFGGGGTPLKDIKLFLYANKVTKGTITLSKPQVEVGTYATDWRPNPADATKSIEMMLKQIESVRKGGSKSGKKRD